MHRTNPPGMRTDRFSRDDVDPTTATGTHADSSRPSLGGSAGLTVDTKQSAFHQQSYQQQQQQQQQQGRRQNKLQRRQPNVSPASASPSTPTAPPTVARASTSAAPGPAATAAPPEATPAAGEKKKIRRFFGLGGGSSSNSSSNSNSNSGSNSGGAAAERNPSTGGRLLLGRSVSTRTRPVSQQILPLAANPGNRFNNTFHSSTGNPDYSLPTTSNDHRTGIGDGNVPSRPAAGTATAARSPDPASPKDQQRRSPSAARSRISRPAPIAEESRERNPSYRHSIAILPGFEAASSFQHSPDTPSFHTPGSETGHLRAPFSVFNTSATQSPDADEVGSKPSSSWSGSRPPPSAESQYHSYNGSRYLHPTDSRPSSRHSVEPSSPTQPQQQHQQPSQHQQYIAYHPRGAVSQTSINKLEVSRDPSPLHQAPPPRGQPSQSGQGNYGSTLDVETANKKLQQKQLSMVQNNGEGARGATPPPNKSKEDLASLDFAQLLSKHEELNDKYRKVKKYYFEKDAQVTNLQNTVAHQRLSQSRTSLDDNEYANRFQRLDGAINNLAFNVRKDWKAVPPWLSPYVNNDAAVSKTKEMTAVGRACISRWLVDEIFDRVFHPGLEPNLSSNLKIIERNLRRFAPPVKTDEERDTILTKISNWRLATLDGLAEALNSPAATEYRNELTRGLVETLTSDLEMNLKTPTPPGLEAGVIGIIELAVGLAANLPLESRDVYVQYILPGVMLNETYMKVEGNLPPLTNPGEAYAVEQDQMLQQRRGSGDESMGGDEGNPPIGGFVGAGPKDRKGNGQGRKGDDEKKEVEKVRFAAFMTVTIKGKDMLVKAPVFI